MIEKASRIAALGLVAALVLGITTTSLALTADEAAAPEQQARIKQKKELTEEQKQELETMRAQEQAKLEAFKATLSEEQLAAFNEMTPIKQAGEKVQTKANADMTAKSTRRHQEPTEEQKQEHEAMREQMQAKREAFEATLTDAQNQAYSELFPAKTELHKSEGRPGRNIEAIEAKTLAGIGELSADQLENAPSI